MDEFIGTVDIKAKGVSVTGSAGGATPIVYDVYDLVHPAVENNALFITTNFVKTRNQTRGVCEGVVPCSVKNPCKKGLTKNGVATGVCMSNGFCEINSWCPLETGDVNTNPNHILDATANFTIFARADGRFPNLSPNQELTTANGTQLTWNYNLFYLAVSFRSVQMHALEIISYILPSRTVLGHHCCRGPVDRQQSRCTDKTT